MSPPPKYNRPEAPQRLSQSIRLECSSQALLTHPGVCTGLLPKDTAPAPPSQAPGSSCSKESTEQQSQTHFTAEKENLGFFYMLT